MADEYGVPQPDNPEDYQQFMLRMYDMIEEAGDIEACAEGIECLKSARLHFLEEFERKFPGYGSGRAVWPRS